VIQTHLNHQAVNNGKVSVYISNVDENVFKERDYLFLNPKIERFSSRGGMRQDEPGTSLNCNNSSHVTVTGS